MVNEIRILGNLGANPEIKTTQSGTTICNLSVATREKWKDKEGKSQEHTEWHKVVCFGRLAELCVQNLSKGREVYIEGRVKTTSWSDDSGVKHYKTNVIARRLLFFGGGNSAPKSTEPRFDPNEEIPF